jgi:hypothetical protein
VGVGSGVGVGAGDGVGVGGEGDGSTGAVEVLTTTSRVGSGVCRTTRFRQADNALDAAEIRSTTKRRRFTRAILV